MGDREFQQEGGKKLAPDPTDSDRAFDVEAARYEVLKFGISNEKQRDKRLNAKQQLLVSLGAKAPKNKYVNYKELKRELSEKRQKEALHELHSWRSTFARLKTKISIRDKKRKQRGIDVTAGYGKLKNGELVVGADVRRTMRKVQQNAKRRRQQQNPGSRRTK
ncbi:uncharacterized protein C1orf131 [Galendromus occidentalis]|uniref:Uncharacterized protein C1orf131 n=1 Tax=Galendromus occidentalis TaxID=34638 RepID=A0AAJ7WJ31_9ACAR|nr:uncharacterized protein C1orf131 [Galendromus occidentalis]